MQEIETPNFLYERSKEIEEFEKLNSVAEAFKLCSGTKPTKMQTVTHTFKDSHEHAMVKGAITDLAPLPDLTCSHSG